MNLPHILQQVADIAGPEAALRLAESRGGRRLYVPEKPTEQLIAEIGEAAAAALAQLYPNEEVAVPLGPTGALHHAHRVMDEGIEAGLKTPEIALRSGLTERTVHRRKAVLLAELARGTKMVQ